MGWIYILTSPSGKSYIGQTTKKHIWQRFKQHCTGGNCRAIHNAIKLYGHWDEKNKTISGFEIDFYECPDEDLDFDEGLLIEEMGTLVPSGYNLTKGGITPKHNIDTINKMSSSSRKGGFHLPTGVSLLSGGYQARHEGVLKYFTSRKHTNEEKKEAAIVYRETGNVPNWYKKY